MPRRAQQVTQKLSFFSLDLEALVRGAWDEHAGEVPKIHSEAALKIGQRIRSVRQRLNISLEDLGELSEMSWTSIGKIERGASSPTAETLVRLATALEVDPGTFLSGIHADDYGRRLHRFSARDLIRARSEHEQRGA